MIENRITFIVSKQNSNRQKTSFYARKFLSFPFPTIDSFYRFARTYILCFFFRIFGVTAVVSYFFLCKFAREIGARLTEIDPLAHAPRLTAVFITGRFISRGNLTKKSETAFR